MIKVPSHLQMRNFTQWYCVFVNIPWPDLTVGIPTILYTKHYALVHLILETQCTNLALVGPCWFAPWGPSEVGPAGAKGCRHSGCSAVWLICILPCYYIGLPYNKFGKVYITVSILQIINVSHRDVK